MLAGRKLVLLSALLAMVFGIGCSAVAAEVAERNLEVLFFGDDAGHKPIERYKIFKEVCGHRGINLTYEKRMEAWTPENLAKFDVVLVYANHQKISDEQLAAINGFVSEGGGLVPVHCGSACFKGTPGWTELVGGKIDKHGEGMMTARVVESEHPTMKGFVAFEAWDETYKHKDLAKDITVLQRHGEEPWTWVRSQGKGRVFYTAHGHDERCWNLEAFHDLLERGIRWAAGDGIKPVALPALRYETPLLPEGKSEVPVLKVQEPLSPEETLKRAQVPPGFEISLFAAEPDVVRPIAICWDERDRLWVVEALDYPNNVGGGNDRIKICEDTDGDGKADKFTVFADKLTLGASLVHSTGGVIVMAGTQIVFLKDTNGDDKADERVVLMDGFNTRDTHAGVSNLRRGFDGWIYGTVGVVGFKGNVGGKPLEFDTGPFRFLPDGSRAEFIGKTTNNTWGLGFTEQFDLLGSTANRQPSWQVVGDGGETIRTTKQSQVFPVTLDVQGSDGWEPPLEVLGEGRIRAKSRNLTAGAGHGIYTARLFPEEWWNKAAFVCEPTGHLVAVGVLTSKDADFSADFEGNNLYASSDAWSAPVAAETGPDGAVWVADWYNIIVQHNRPGAPFEKSRIERGKGGAYVTPLREKALGRIYRIAPKGSKPVKAAGELVAGLGDVSLVRRLNAQRMIVDGGRKDLIPALKNAASGEYGIHAIYALGELGYFAAGSKDGLAMLGEMLEHPEAAQRRAALANWPAEEGCDFDPRKERDPFVVREWLILAARMPANEALGRQLQGWYKDQAKLRRGVVLGRCYAAAAARHAVGFVLEALDNPEEVNSNNPVYKTVTAAIGASRAPEVVARLEKDESEFAVELKAALNAKAATKQFAPDADQLARGAAVYARTCAGCHQNDGRGTEGAFPPLDGSKVVAAEPGVSARIVLHGLSGPVKVAGKPEINSVMPAVAEVTDADIADVLTYVRHSWSNDAAPVAVAEVGKAREATKDRQAPWTLKELKQE